MFVQLWTMQSVRKLLYEFLAVKGVLGGNENFVLLDRIIHYLGIDILKGSS